MTLLREYTTQSSSNRRLAAAARSSVGDGGRIEGARKDAHPAALDAVRTGHEDGLGRLRGFNAFQRLAETEEAPEIEKVVPRRASYFQISGAFFLGEIDVAEGAVELACRTPACAGSRRTS